MTTLDWQKSSYCGEANNCLAIAVAADGSIRIRESETPDSTITTTSHNLQALILGIKAGEFDHLLTD